MVFNFKKHCRTHKQSIQLTINSNFIWIRQNVLINIYLIGDKTDTQMCDGE